MVDRRQGGYVVTPNVDHVCLAQRSAALREAYRASSLSLPDGQPLMWMSRLLGNPLPEKVSGSDFVVPLLELAGRRGWRVYLFGATPEVSEKAARRISDRFPGLRIVGRNTSRWDPGDAPSSSEDPVVREIRKSNTDIVIVALGCPKQELWMHRHRDALGGAVALGLGGSLDFLAGAVRRAPAWISSSGFEWLYRLAQEPGRLAHRYLVRDTQIIPIFMAQWLRRSRVPTAT